MDQEPGGGGGCLLSLGRLASLVIQHPGYTLVFLVYARDQWVIDPQGRHFMAALIEMAAVAFLVVGVATFSAMAMSPYTHRLRPDGRWERVRKQPNIRQRIHRRGQYVQVKAHKGKRLTPAEKAELRAYHWRNRYVGRVARKVNRPEVAQLGQGVTTRSRWEQGVLRYLPTEKPKRTKAMRQHERAVRRQGRTEKGMDRDRKRTTRAVRKTERRETRASIWDAPEPAPKRYTPAGPSDPKPPTGWWSAPEALERATEVRSARPVPPPMPPPPPSSLDQPTEARVS
jgi:hypothetical protein